MKKSLIILLCGLLICTGCNVQQTINDGLDAAGDIMSAGQGHEVQSKRDCYDDAKEIIKMNIDTPASAVFPPYDSDDVEVFVNVSDNSCRVSSYVDAENMMGATIREYYTLDIMYFDYLGGSDYQYDISSY